MARIKDINDAFNEQLLSLNESNADNVVFDLGLPSRNVRKVVRWINEGKLRYVNKEKAQEYLFYQSAPIAAAAAYSALNSAAKTVQSFRNPNISEKNLIIG